MQTVCTWPLLGEEGRGGGDLETKIRGSGPGSTAISTHLMLIDGYTLQAAIISLWLHLTSVYAEICTQEFYNRKSVQLPYGFCTCHLDNDVGNQQ